MRDILIVEDGEQERARLLKLFSEAGYTVQACETVTEAERATESEGFRLAILDIGLADKSGSHLFHTIKQGHRANHVIIFTGNPSVHLKQRFLDEGAVDYIVKASPQSTNGAFLGRVKEIIGEAKKRTVDGIPLETFLSSYVTKNSRRLFLESDDTYPPCKSCHGREYVVTFSQKPQLPPTVYGSVLCIGCGRPMDPEVE